LLALRMTHERQSEKSRGRRKAHKRRENRRSSDSDLELVTIDSKFLRALLVRRDRFLNESLDNFWVILCVALLIAFAKLSNQRVWQFSCWFLWLPILKNAINCPTQFFSHQGWCLFLQTSVCDCMTMYLVGNKTAVLVEAICCVESCGHFVFSLFVDYHKWFRLGFVSQGILYVILRSEQAYTRRSYLHVIVFIVLKLMRVWIYQLIFLKSHRCIILKSSGEAGHWAVMDNKHFIELLYLHEKSNDNVLHSIHGFDFKVDVTCTDPIRYKTGRFFRYLYIPYIRYGAIGFSTYDLKSPSFQDLFKVFNKNPYYSVKDHSCQKLAIMSSHKMGLSMLRQSDLKNTFSMIISGIFAWFIFVCFIVCGLTDL